ncbi:acyltransferase family protein [Hymenobacter sp. HMF4947]|uniref:Acyltransferase family protein n=1 Tax=Hymenobacter ginkgonis TaxID=2682976 RepID=A0A7K1TG18_9BACT|nr:acyltransferase [Hymenobacter ginkgonis]MVN77347.1 acyltransferase family protein [Hymenobacter ginkgonis]
MPPTSLVSKPHYPILDGLRGVAALVVVAFHLCEAHATSHLDQVINHGYLAVDFFFLLSGFVIGYAYDDRWQAMTVGSFFKRRLVRLQPMVVLGMVIGAVLFYAQTSALWPAIGQTPGWKVLLIMVVGCLMLPVPPALDIRGWNETYPLNGPGWSLFFEYLANILYATVVRKFSKLALGILVFLAAVALVQLAVTSPAGDVIGGWSLEPLQLHIGFARMAYPFFAGLLLFRVAKLRTVNNAFLWCSLLVIAALAMPRVGGPQHLWMNGLYDSLSIIFVFPLIVFLGASGEVVTSFSKKLCGFLGDISYPIYITHYPLIYTYTAWVQDKKIPWRDALPVAVLVFLLAVGIAYACLKFYDEPVRQWLKKKVAV